MPAPATPDPATTEHDRPRLQSVEALLAAQQSLRAWSLIVTFFGDSIVPRGGEVWLGTITQVMAGLGVDERAVRAAVSRLTRDGWLERFRSGRHSFYRLKGEGHPEFSAATEKVYGPPPGPFHGRLAVLVERPGAEPAGEALAADGWGRLGAGVWCRFADVARVRPRGGGFIPIEGKMDVADATELVARAWDVASLAESYRAFIAAFAPLAAAAPPPFEALLCRTLLIHAWRRIVLRDPMLPPDLVGPDWPGSRARELTAALYRMLSPGADRWLAEYAVDRDGPLVLPPGAVEGRFATRAR